MGQKGRRKSSKVSKMGWREPKRKLRLNLEKARRKRWESNNPENDGNNISDNDAISGDNMDANLSDNDTGNYNVDVNISDNDNASLNLSDNDAISGDNMDENVSDNDTVNSGVYILP